MIEFTPKGTFQTFNPAVAKELQSHRQDQWLIISTVFTISQMAHKGATAEQLSGARMFVDTLLNLWESETPENKLPQQRLSTYDGPLVDAIATAEKQSK